MIGGNLAQLCSACVDRSVAQQSVVGAQHRVNNHGAIVGQVVIDLCSAQSVIAVARVHRAFEIDPRDRSGVDGAQSIAQRGQRTRRKKNYAAFRRELQRAFLSREFAEVFDLHHSLNGDAISVFINHHGIRGKRDSSFGTEDRFHFLGLRRKRDRTRQRWTDEHSLTQVSAGHRHAFFDHRGNIERWLRAQSCSARCDVFRELA